MPCKTEWQRKWLGLDCVDAKIQELADIAQAFCRRWCHNEATPSLLVMVGESGRAKTHVAKRIQTFCDGASIFARDTGRWMNDDRTCPHAPQVFYCPWPWAVDEFKKGEYWPVDLLIKTDLAILDDVGAEHDPSKNACNKLCQILSRREKRFTVVTTNIRPEHWANHFESRVDDRLLRNSEIVDLTGVPAYSSIL